MCFCGCECVGVCVTKECIKRRMSENVNEVEKQNKRQRDETVVGTFMILITLFTLFTLLQTCHHKILKCEIPSLEK